MSSMHIDADRKRPRTENRVEDNQKVVTHIILLISFNVLMVKNKLVLVLSTTKNVEDLVA
jgi:hypothetical protein